MRRPVRYRRAYTDPRGHRVAGGFVVASTRHPAADPNGGDLRVRFELVDGVLDAVLPPNTYALHARLRAADGTAFARTDYVTLGGTP